MAIDQLKENWKRMQEGLFDAAQQAVTNVMTPNSIGNIAQNHNQPKIDSLMQQIRDIETKIAPLADKKRKLEDELARLKKQG